MPAAPAPLTDEQKKEQVIRFLSQKRETFFQIFSGSLSRGLDFIPSKEEALDLVDRAIEMADAAVEKLFPIPKEEPKAE